VGTTMNFFSSPPASAMNRSTMPVPSVAPPPTMTSVPFAGPYSGGPSDAGSVGACGRAGAWGRACGYV